MPNTLFDTAHLQACLQRFNAGDPDAADWLFCQVCVRMEHVAHRMLCGFPNVRARTETADVVQGSVVRLLNTLQKIQPTSTRHFFNLVALHVRRELIDLARSYAARPETSLSARQGAGDSETTALGQLAEPATDAGTELELWSRFHEAVEQLPVEEREIISLAYYHGSTQLQIAELLHISERTVRTRWRSACVNLKRFMKGQVPDF